MHGTVKTYNLRQAAHKWGDNHNCRVTLPREREREVQDPQQVRRPETPHQEDEPPEHLVFLSGELEGCGR